MTSRATKKRGTNRVKGGKGRTIDAAAKEAAKKAKAAGAQGKRGGGGTGSMARLVLRDRALVLGHRAGVSTAKLAKEWEISQRSVQEAIKAAGGRPSALDAPPMQLVEEGLSEYREQVRVWGSLVMLLFEQEAWPALVGAMKAQAEAHERWMDTLRELGKLPDNLELFRLESELRQAARLMLEKVKLVADGELSPADFRVQVLELLAADEMPELSQTTGGR